MLLIILLMLLAVVAGWFLARRFAEDCDIRVQSIEAINARN